MDASISTTFATIASQYLGTESPESSEDFIINDDNSSPQADEISGFSRPLLTFAAIMTILIMLVGIFGNILTTVALLKCPKVRNVAAAFIISLCIADCIFCAVVLPFSAFRFIQGTWTHGDFLCKLIPFIQYGNIGVSLLCIAMITINRYIMIAHHSGYAKIYKRHWIGAMIIFCWVFSYGMQLPTLLGVWGEFGFDQKLGTCSILRDQFGRSSKTALFAIAFVIPCIIIIACYARIFYVVHESEIRMRKHAHKQNTIPNNMRKMPTPSSTTLAAGTGNGNGNGTGIINVTSDNRLSQQPQQQPNISNSSFETTSDLIHNKHKITTTNNNMSITSNNSQKSIRIKDQRDAKAKRNEWRITKMVLAIFLSFVGCYLPITIVKVIDQNVSWPGFHIFAYIMLYLSSCINPIIYVIMNKQYRQAYKTVLMCKPSRLLPFTNNNNAGGSSAGEKWKDIGYSYNHSRTMVSQVSLADPNNINCTSISSSTPNQPPMVELTNTNTTKLFQQQQQHHLNNNNNNNNNNIMPSSATIIPNSNITNTNRRNWLMNHNNSSSSNNNTVTNNISQNSYNNQTMMTPANMTIVSNNNNNNTTNMINNSTFTNIPLATIQSLTETPVTTMTTSSNYHPLQNQSIIVTQQSLPQNSTQLEVTPQQLRSTQHPDFLRPGIRITLDEGDVIVEEVEEEMEEMEMQKEKEKSMETKIIMNNNQPDKQIITSSSIPTYTVVDPISTININPQQQNQPTTINQQKQPTGDTTINSIIVKTNDIPIDDNNTKVINNNNLDIKSNNINSHHVSSMRF